MERTRSLRREFMGALIDSARHLSHFIDIRGQRLGLTGAQMRVLARLARREGATQVELAADMEVRPISLSGLIDKLTRQGLVERRDDARDRRINHLHLTPQGHAMAAEIDGFREDIAGEVLRMADDAETACALAVLRQLKKHLKEQRDKTPVAAE